MTGLSWKGKCRGRDDNIDLQLLGQGTSFEQLSEKQKQMSVFFSICYLDRTGETILLYRTEYDIEKNQEKTLTDGEDSRFIMWR